MTHVKLKKRRVKNARRPKGLFRHLSNSFYASHPVFIHKPVEDFRPFIGLDSLYRHAINKATLIATLDPYRCASREPPTALKLPYVPWTCTHSSRCVASGWGGDCRTSSSCRVGSSSPNTRDGNRITESQFLPFSSVRCETSRYHIHGRARNEGAPMMTYL